MSRKPQDILIKSRALRGGLVQAVMARRLPRLGMRILIMPGLARDRLVLPYHEEVRNRQECFHASMELVQETAMLREGVESPISFGTVQTAFIIIDFQVKWQCSGLPTTLLSHCHSFLYDAGSGGEPGQAEPHWEHLQSKRTQADESTIR